MKEVYITVIPLQGKFQLDKCLYEFKNIKGDKNIETCFPIIPIINNHLDSGFEKEVIAIRFDNDDANRNRELFGREIEALEKRMINEGDTINKIKITDVSIEEDQLSVIDGSFLLKLIGNFEDESVVYSDITYGTKPMSAMTIYALLALEKMKFVDVEGIYYGEIQRKDGKIESSYLYDVTRLMHIYRAVENFDIMGISDKEGMLRKFLNPEEES